jgi:hypothetical protein
MKPFKRPKNYLRLSRKQKKKLYINLKNKITKTQYNFITDNELSDNTQYADIYFIDQNKTIYNTIIVTTSTKWKDELTMAAIKKLYATVKDPKSLFEDIPAEIHPYYGQLYTISDPIREELGNMNAMDYIDKTKLELSIEKSVYTQESFEILPDYLDGIGLRIVVNEPFLTAENINKHVQKFIKNDCKPWVSEEKLIYEL